MRLVTTGLLSFCVSGISGCMPLEQAPLVYVSKAQMGVGVSANTPDSPGLDINIGYKGLDAAFVPVVVAKSCPEKIAGECSGSAYQTKIVTGKNSVTGSSFLDDRAIVEHQNYIRNADEKIRQNSLIIASIRDAPTQIQDKNSELTSLNAIDPTTGQARVLTTDEVARKAKLEADLVALAPKATAQAVADANALDQENKKIAAELGKRESALEQLLAKQNRKSGDEKEDALSVYGSFNGSANGKEDGAGLTLGKSFSTGVAAQHIAQKLGVSACLSNAATILSGETDTAKRQALRADLVAACSATNERD